MLCISMGPRTVIFTGDIYVISLCEKKVLSANYEYQVIDINRYHVACSIM